ncbi:hypothetical protein P3S67_017430 [Capsicum chacoense]
MDGQDGDNKQSTADMTVFVQNLLQQMVSPVTLQPLGFFASFNWNYLTDIFRFAANQISDNVRINNLKKYPFFLKLNIPYLIRLLLILVSPKMHLVICSIKYNSEFNKLLIAFLVQRLLNGSSFPALLCFNVLGLYSVWQKCKVRLRTMHLCGGVLPRTLRIAGALVLQAALFFFMFFVNPST